MIAILKSQSERDTFLQRLAGRSIDFDPELVSLVTAIIRDVRQRGDDALIEYGKRFDQVELTRDELRVSPTELKASAAAVNSEVLTALKQAIVNVRSFHEHQIERSWEISPQEGITLGQRISPVERVGLYVPGGTAAYPSSVIMNVVPAQVAGVERLVVATPPGSLNKCPEVAAVLNELNVDEVYAIGGAHAIAALAFGTETVPRVDKITGPGNRYVAAAKKIVFGSVGIDSIAGPSEVVIVADETAEAAFIAADLLAQAEHGEDASSLLITTSKELAEQVVTEVASLLKDLPRRKIVEVSLARYGAILLVEDLALACELVNALAPEHVEVMTSDVNSIASMIRHAGALFLGSHTPEAVGDYFAGPNHILPTQRNARFASALGVYDFVKRTSVLSYSPGALSKATRQIKILAETEGLDAHARSVSIRGEAR